MNMQTNYNPDVLTCLANLSSDEVFTPPNIANQMLDMLPKELWSNKNATFLDPCSKSGVFLREIAKRLNEGLKHEIPDLQKRLDHIYTKQIFGIGITELTALTSRRSLYCSKYANGKYSVCKEFNDEVGNIFFDKTDHTWKNGRCLYCGANKSNYKRDEELETHAYQFIHSNIPDKIKGMKFDVIIGNPPYQMEDGGHGSSASPIYHHFIEQAKKLNPRYLSMIIPARWYAGGKGLNAFRGSMLEDDRIRYLNDFFDSAVCFPGVDISGGVCYFLWNRDSRGVCEIVNQEIGDVKNSMRRPLLEEGTETFIRFNNAVSIFRKVRNISGGKYFDTIVSRSPFGLPTNISNLKTNQFTGAVKVYAYPKNGYLKKADILDSSRILSKYKVFISEAYGERGSFPYLVTAKPFMGEENTCCTLTYLTVYSSGSKPEAENIISYMKTKFFRFLILLKKNTQHTSKKVYGFVPLQNFDEGWTDEKLYKKYELTTDEIDFIESMIRPME